MGEGYQLFEMNLPFSSLAQIALAP